MPGFFENIMAKTIAQLTEENKALLVELETAKQAVQALQIEKDNLSTELETEKQALQTEKDALSTQLDTVKEEWAKEFEAHESTKENCKLLLEGLIAENESLKNATLVTPELTSNDVISLQDGRSVQINFGVTIPETGTAYTKEELVNNEEVVTYLLEIGSGAVSIVGAEEVIED